MSYPQTIPNIVRGDISPALAITISDQRSHADFSTLQPSDCVFMMEQDGVLIIEDTADSITPSEDNKSALVKREWDAGDTDRVGRCWVSVHVTPWNQTFPDDGPLRLDITRVAGDA